MIPGHFVLHRIYLTLNGIVVSESLVESVEFMSYVFFS